jgi:SnoaL-like domain
MKIPQPISAFIHATNTHNTNELLAAFTDTAVISDEGHDYRGIAEIKKWSEEKLIGAEVTLQPTKTIERNGKTIVTAKVDGNFDKTGLPDPFQMDFDFTIDSNKVAALSIRFPESIE